MTSSQTPGQGPGQKLIYLAGPIDSTPVDQSWRRKIGEVLNEYDIITYDPWAAFNTAFRITDRKVSQSIYNINMVAVENSDLIIVANPWVSVGASREIEFASRHEVPVWVFDLDFNTRITNQKITTTPSLLTGDIKVFRHGVDQIIEAIKRGNLPWN